jgi:UV DNA damage endonuclease
MGRLGLCCISLSLQERDPPLKFQTLTYKRFSSLPREEALEILGQRILNNMIVTNETIKYCHENNLCYRLSSDLFPLVTYETAGVDLTDLPNHDDIQDAFDLIENTISETKVRISCHPSEWNVLASKNPAAVNKTIDELNFYSSFMDRIGCPANYNSPINLHIHNKDGSYDDIIARFIDSFSKLDENCRSRLVIENDDKPGCWSVRELIEHFHPKTKIPITYDYLHDKCNPSYESEEQAIQACYSTWNDTTPLFHYSESAPGNNPRKHAEYATQPFDTYGLDFNLDFEIKQKDLAIANYLKLYPVNQAEKALRSIHCG